MHRPFLPVLLGTAALLLAPSLAPSPVRAHAIQSDLQLLGGEGVPHSHAGEGPAVSRLQLSSSFSTGQPARDAAVRLLKGGGQPPLELGRTDSEGRLAFSVPAHLAAEAEIQVDAGAGHRDWIELSEVGHRHQASRPWSSLRGPLLGLAPVAGLGLLGGLALLRRPRG
jgi:nickel transport protein